jgi:hypothetical protein
MKQFARQADCLGDRLGGCLEGGVGQLVVLSFMAPSLVLPLLM